MSEFLLQLGHIAAMGGRLRVLLCLSSDVNATKIVNLNGVQKFVFSANDSDLAKWSNDDMRRLTDGLAGKYGLSDDIKTRLFDLGTIAHCPRPIVEDLGTRFQEIHTQYFYDMAICTKNEWSSAGIVNKT